MPYRMADTSGQVGNTKSLAGAIQELREQIEYDRRHNQGGASWYCIEKQDEETGEWFQVTLTSKQIEKAEGK